MAREILAGQPIGAAVAGAEPPPGAAPASPATSDAPAKRPSEGGSAAPPSAAYDVTPQVRLAGQPRPADWAAWSDEGFHTVLNLRRDPERAAAQAAAAEAAGLEYLHRPWPADALEPEHVAEFAAIVEAPDTGRLVFHCRTASRVGVLWLLYRQLHGGWSRDEALAELRAAGYDDDSLEVFDFCADDYFERVS